MNRVKSKRSTLNLQVRTGLGGPSEESDMTAAGVLGDEDLAEVAAYGRTKTCVAPCHGQVGFSVSPFQSSFDLSTQTSLNTIVF